MAPATAQRAQHSARRVRTTDRGGTSAHAGTLRCMRRSNSTDSLKTRYQPSPTRPAPEVSERDIRARLRSLDALLAEEMRDAGTLDPCELNKAATLLLGQGVISHETVCQWWEYAWRRGWLEEAGNRCRLSGAASSDLQATRERTDSPDPRKWAQAIARWTVAGGLAGVVGVLSGKSNLGASLAILVVLGAIALSLAITAPLLSLVDRPFDVFVARQACDWLAGQPVRGNIRWRESSEPRVLYKKDEFEAPCLVAPSTTPLTAQMDDGARKRSG